MKRFLIALFLAACSWSCGDAEAVEASYHQWAPDNNLWVEDRFDMVANYSSQQTFNRIIDIGQQLYNPVASSWGERLTIRRLWSDSTVNASAWRDGYGSTEIIMYGGMARRPEVLPLSFALVLCHELSHLYGGTPYIEPRVWISAEGQSDWMGAGWCLRNIAEKLQDNTSYQATDYMRRSCNGNELCLKKLAGANGLGALLAVLSGGPAPRFETPDPTVVSRTEVSYPRTTQCRLDTYYNGIMNQARPRCWYKP